MKVEASRRLRDCGYIGRPFGFDGGVGGDMSPDKQ